MDPGETTIWGAVGAAVVAAAVKVVNGAYEKYLKRGEEIEKLQKLDEGARTDMRDRIRELEGKLQVAQEKILGLIIENTELRLRLRQ